MSNIRPGGRNQPSKDTNLCHWIASENVKAYTDLKCQNIFTNLTALSISVTLHSVVECLWMLEAFPLFVLIIAEVITQNLKSNALHYLITRRRKMFFMLLDKLLSCYCVKLSESVRTKKQDRYAGRLRILGNWTTGNQFSIRTGSRFPSLFILHTK